MREHRRSAARETGVKLIVKKRKLSMFTGNVYPEKSVDLVNIQVDKCQVNSKS